jgi:hypothetical protein
MKQLLSLFLAITVSHTALAVVLSFQTTDVSGDPDGTWNPTPIDLVGTTLVLDNVTGAYTIDVTASAANPFTGSFRINWNSWNETQSVFFTDNVNDFAFGAVTATTVSLMGISPLLVGWQPGDVIYLTSAGSSSPLSFGSGVMPSAFAGGDFFPNAPTGSGPLTVSASSVPDVGSSIGMLLLGLTSLVAARRFSAKARDI